MAESGLVAGSVVERFDVVEQDCSQFGSSELGPVAVGVADLAFERRPGRFHCCVIECVASRPIGRVDVPVSQSVGELERCVVRTPVCVMNKIAIRVTASQCHDDGVDDKVGVVALSHRPAADAAVVQIDDAGQEEATVDTFELGDISDPFQVRHDCGEVPFDQIGSWSRVRSASSPFLAGMSANEAALGHQASDTFEPNPNARASQLSPHPR